MMFDTNRRTYNEVFNYPFLSLISFTPWLRIFLNLPTFTFSKNQIVAPFYNRQRLNFILLYRTIISSLQIIADHDLRCKYLQDR